MKIFIALFSLLILSGCTDYSSYIKQAELEQDPIVGLKIIYDGIDKCRECSSRDELYEARDDYILKRLSEKHPNEKLLQILYESRPFNGWIKTKIKYRDYVLDRVATVKSKELLVAAGYIYGDDRIGVVNIEKQIKSFTDAWVKGSKSSPGYLSRIFASIGDYENSYLWSLRCTVDCTRRGTLQGSSYIMDTDLEELDDKLTYKKVVEIQKASAAGVMRINNEFQP